LNLALAYGRQKKFKTSRGYASQAISLRPSDAQAYAIRASAFFADGDLLRAREDAETALALNPKVSIDSPELKNMINSAPNEQIYRKPRGDDSESKPILPSWFYGYAGFVTLVAVSFLFVRYRNAVPSGSVLDSHGRRLKTINIKEQYDFIRQIGEGGMGKVYEAYDTVLKRKVAVKRIRPELLKSDYIRSQFLAEARLVAMLRHPCIVEIYTVIETMNSLYLVFEYVEGQTLEMRLDIENYVSYEDTKKIFGSVCKGLAYAHSQDIIHCDLKPGNIMICDSGAAKVMDFGVARRIAENRGSIRTVAGTPAYMSPEQQKGFLSKQSDIYSLAVCFYEALVGAVPWSIKGFDINTKKIVPPSEFSREIPREVDELLARSLADDPRRRPQSVEEFWSVLEKAAASK
jgi:serine/threonine protein kinase